jgi:hypothetical protein
MFLKLSADEIRDGTTFILQLASTAEGGGGDRGSDDDNRVQWAETLRGETAKRWYQIYRLSDWAALRAEAADVFHRRVTGAEATAIRTARRRCVFIHTPAVGADELAPGRGSL